MSCSSGWRSRRSAASRSSSSASATTRPLDFRFLLWNLFLAWVPFVLALVVYDRYRRGTPLARLLPALVLWLLFLPNAPYIVTDFVHLSAARTPPLWFDGVELSAFAWTGMLLGFVSLYLVHAVVRHRFGAVDRLGSACSACSRSSAPASSSAG